MFLGNTSVEGSLGTTSGLKVEKENEGGGFVSFVGKILETFSVEGSLGTTSWLKVEKENEGGRSVSFVGKFLENTSFGGSFGTMSGNLGQEGYVSLLEKGRRELELGLNLTEDGWPASKLVSDMGLYEGAEEETSVKALWKG